MQFVSDIRRRPVPRFEPQLGTLLSLLRERGHELNLLGLARFDEAAIKSALARDLPQLVYADISPVCSDIARRTLQHVQEREFLPVVAGGGYASLAVEECLSLPGVQAVAVGEPDASLVTYFERMKDPAIGQIVQGVWLRDERGLARPSLPGLVEELDSLPWPERELFRYGEIVQRTGELEIAVGRGCPQHCAYCGNPTIAALYADKGQWVRRRSSDNVLEEIAALRTAYPAARTVRFLDHLFALDPAWLNAFLSAYKSACDLPFACHLRANAVTPDLPQRLAAAGCRMAHIEVISGSDFVRNEVFQMELSEEQIVAAFDGLHAAQMRTRATVYLGAPYESEASIDETHALLQKIKPHLVDVRPYYPWPGTAAARLSAEHGWLHSRGQEQFHHDEPGIDMPACRPKIVTAAVRRFRQDFPTTISEPWWRRWSTVSAALGQVFHKRG